METRTAPYNIDARLYALALSPFMPLRLLTFVPWSLCISAPLPFWRSTVPPGIPCRFGQCASSAPGSVRLVIGRRMILSNAMHRSLLEPIFLTHTALNEPTLDQTHLDPYLEPHLKTLLDPNNDNDNAAPDALR